MTSSKLDSSAQNLDESRCNGDWQSVADWARKLQKHSHHHHKTTNGVIAVYAATALYEVEVEKILDGIIGARDAVKSSASSTNTTTATNQWQDNSGDANANGHHQRHIHFGGHHKRQQLSVGTPHDRLTPVENHNQLEAVAASLETLHRELVQDLGQTVTQTAQETSYILGAVYAHTLFLLGRYGQAIAALQHSNATIEPMSNCAYNYVHVALVKRTTVLAAAYERLDDVQNAEHVYQNGIPDTIRHSPQGLIWSERLSFGQAVFFCESKYQSQFSDSRQELALRDYYRISRLRMGEEAQWSNNSGLAQMLNDYSPERKKMQLKLWRKYLELSPTQEETKSILGDYARGLFQTVQFPRASDTGADVVDEFIETMTGFWRKSVVLQHSSGRLFQERDITYTQEVLAWVARGTQVTFQSQAILRCQIELLVANGQYSEALAAFNTYKAYEEIHRTRKEPGDRPDGLSRVFHLIITKVLINHEKDRERAKEAADALILWMDNAPSENVPEQMQTQTADDKEELINAHPENTFSQRKRKTINSALALGLGAVGIAYSYYSKNLAAGEYQQCVSKAIYYLQKSADLDVGASADIAYEHVFLLVHALDDMPKAIALCRQNLNVFADYPPLWHLMALLVSARDEHTAALTIITTALDRAIKVGATDVCSPERKAAIIEMKLTQLALYEAIDPEDCLTHLPEALALYSQLFTYIPKQPAAEETIPEETVATIDEKRTRSRRSLHAIRRVSDIKKSSRARSAAVTAANAASAVSNSSSATNMTPSITALKMLQKIWLVISGIYWRANMLKEAEQCVTEAEQAYSVTSDTCAELGLYRIETNALRAMQLFDSALQLDSSNLRAVVGFAHLVLSKSDENIFISKSDERAANARIKSLLERSVGKCPGRTCSEAWWLLGTIYESEGHVEKASHAMWRSVTLEEIRAVRSYTITRDVFDI